MYCSTGNFSVMYWPGGNVVGHAGRCTIVAFAEAVEHKLLLEQRGWS